jgi:hypothetical protein
MIKFITEKIKEIINLNFIHNLSHHLLKIHQSLKLIILLIYLNHIFLEIEKKLFKDNLIVSINVIKIT